MTAWLLALKRVVRGKLFLFSLLLAALVMASTSLIGSRTVEPKAGFVLSASGGEITEKISASMTELGVLRYDSPEDLRRAVSDGEVDCGILFREDLEELVVLGELNEAASVLVSGSTSFPKFFAGVAGSALFSAAAPYLSADVLRAMGFDATDEMVIEEYEALREEGDLFTFRTEYLAGAEPTPVEEAFTGNLCRAALALLFFVAIVPETYRSFRRELSAFGSLLGPGRTLTRVLLPLSVWRLALSLLAVVGGIALGEYLGGKDLWPLLLPGGLYLLLLFSAGFLLSVLLPGKTDLRVLLPVWLLLSLILCPIYTDLGEWFSVLRTVRLLFPPTWLWSVESAPLTALLSAVGMLFLAIGLFAVQKRRFLKAEE